MNFLNVFEQRVGSIFGDTGPVMPFSFKKLAKQVTREMESETFVINGIDTAPVLYTILVSPDDDEIMRPLYAAIAKETAQFVEGQAQSKGYTFVGQPLVRFMVDPALRSGKFSVFAENIDARTLKQLRAEEDAFLSGAALSVMRPIEEKFVQAPMHPKTLRRETYEDAQQEEERVRPQILPLSNESPLTPNEAGLAVIPPLREDDEHNQAQAKPQEYDEYSADVIPKDSCLLIDRETGQTYTVMAPGTLIGRERNAGGIVLRDPNISRRHAEISFNNGVWTITDLNSTNGTLVNGVDVTEAVLHEADCISLGLIVLEFQEN